MVSYILTKGLIIVKYKYEHEIDIPLSEKTFILPQPRLKLFENLISNYGVFCPELKLIYAYLNYNSKTPVDYLVIFEGMSKGEKIILWDAPYLYSNKTIPAYRYICRNDLYSDFFIFIRESLCRTSYSKFKEFIPSSLCELSFNPNDELYWKRPENADTLLKAMLELSLIYTPSPGQYGVRVIPHKKDLKDPSNVGNK